METICYKCKNFRNLEPTGPRKDMWYNHVCVASSKPNIFDPVTGKNSSDSIELTDLYHFCRSVNKGECLKYLSPKGEKVDGNDFNRNDILDIEDANVDNH